MNDRHEDWDFPDHWPDIVMPGYRWTNPAWTDGQLWTFGGDPWPPRETEDWDMAMQRLGVPAGPQDGDMMSHIHERCHGATHAVYGRWCNPLHYRLTTEGFVGPILDDGHGVEDRRCVVVDRRPDHDHNRFWSAIWGDRGTLLDLRPFAPTDRDLRELMWENGHPPMVMLAKALEQRP